MESHTMSPEMEPIARHYTPGNIIYLSYWHSFDRVISFEHDGRYGWYVIVEQVESVDGQWVATGERRSHCTVPGTRDRVEARVNL